MVRCTERIRKMGIKNKGDQKHMPPWLSRLLIAAGLLVIMAQSSGNVLGYKVVGTVVKEDYATLTAEVEALLEQEETMSLLLYLEELEGEEIGAWGADLKFGRKYRRKIARMAIIGDKKWQEWMTTIVDPFWAREGT